MKKIIYLIVLSMYSCSLSNPQDFRLEGEQQTKELVRELKRVRTRSDLQAAIPKLRKKFTAFAGLILEAREFLLKHPESEPFQPSMASDELFAELSRLYELPGGRELIESAQAEAVARLLANESSLNRTW